MLVTVSGELVPDLSSMTMLSPPPEKVGGGGLAGANPGEIGLGGFTGSGREAGEEGGDPCGGVGGVSGCDGEVNAGIGEVRDGNGEPPWEGGREVGNLGDCDGRGTTGGGPEEAVEEEGTGGRRGGTGGPYIEGTRTDCLK